ncbi:hypothetical protein Tco_0341469, partial [Tanacetum coccineum]
KKRLSIMVSRVSCDGDGVVGVPGVVGVVGIQKKGDPTGSTMMVMMGIIPETTSVCLFVESRVSNPETTFVGVESRVSNPEMTFVGVESKIDTVQAFAISPLGLRGSVRE